MTQNAQLPDPVAAYNHLYDNVHAQVFFGRLASHGYVPQNEKQAVDLLTLAGKLRVVADNEKTAQAADSPYDYAVQALDGVLGQTGFNGQFKTAQANEEDLAIKEAAAELSQDPAIFNSILALKAQEAAFVAEQLQNA
jgi:hypothetical protein